MEKRVIEGYRLSPQQKRLWSLQQVDQGLPYRAQCSVRIEGNLQTKILKAALQDVIHRHEVLRTTFDFLPGMIFPLQVISDDAAPSIHEEDLSGLGSDEQQVRIEELFRQASQRPLDFRKAPLLDASLVALSPQEHLLLVTLPALYADPTSLEILAREIDRSYAALLEDERLPEEPMQYTDLSEILNELIEAEDTEAGSEYWRRRDISALSTLRLPSENQSAGKTDFAPRFVTSTIDPARAAKIEALAARYSTSTDIFLLACWQVLLWRLTGQPDVIVGAASDGRTYEELKGALGLFAKYLPLDSRLEENLRFSEHLKQTDESVREAYEWQEYFAWEQVGAAAGGGVATTESSYLPFAFDFAESPAKHSSAGVSFSVDRQQAYVDKFKVKLSGARRGDALVAQFHYDSNLFTADEIKRLAGQFQQLCASAVDNPEAEVGELKILSDAERNYLLVEFNETTSDYPKDACVHQLFEEQAARTPESVAVVFKDQPLTYRELNSRANQLARRLQALGVGPEVRVGICVERSLEMVVGLLGILKAGGAYVPLDPTYPEERLRFMLDDAGAPVLLTEERLVATLPEHAAAVVRLDADWEMIARESEANPDGGARAENLAYVIYTSGSTGQPKGVMIHHRGLVNYLTWCTSAYAVAEGSGTLVHSPIGFDLTITGLFAPLLVGRSAVLLPEDEGIEALGEALRRADNLSLIKITPPHLELLNQTLRADKAAGKTRAFIIGGEALRGESLSFWRTHAPATRLINEYGPTETVVGCCVYDVPAGRPASGAVPIGRPVANTQLYVLDGRLQPVPIGVSGELYIGGDGVARGYLNRPELTAEKFIPDPFRAEPRARLYRTGDLARHLPDGELEYLGRIDHQVKLRGFRIELGEIETVLGQRAGVREAAVIVREDTPGDQRLVAYTTAAAGQPAPTGEELRDYLKGKLPEHMVPTAFVALDALPLTPNGKVDRKALPAPDHARAGANYTAPQTPGEEALAEIWAAVLGVERVGVYDNFFELGGHSLLVTQVVSRVRETLGVELPLRSLFESPTVAGLAETIENMKGEGAAEPHAPAITPVSRESRRMKVSSEGTLVAPEA